MAKGTAEVPICQKAMLTVKEAAMLTNIGEHKIRLIVKQNPSANFILNVGTKCLLKRELFLKFLEEKYVL